MRFEFPGKRTKPAAAPSRNRDWVNRRQNRETSDGSGGRKRIPHVEANRVPVMMRGSFQGIPMATPRSAAKTQRRVAVPLSIPGAEISLPALPQISVGARLISGCMTLGLAFALYFLWNSPVFRIQNIEVNGLHRISSKEFNLSMNISNQSIFEIDPIKLVDDVKKYFPEFSAVNLEIRLPNDVFVAVQERVPILVWKQEGRTVLVDANGYAFPLRDSSKDVPKLTIQANGNPPSVAKAGLEDLNVQFIPVEMISGILSLSGIVPSNAPLVFDETHGLGWKDKNGWNVYFGEIKDVNMKLKVYEILIKKLKKEKITPSLVSVEFVNAPYYRVEK